MNQYSYDKPSLSTRYGLILAGLFCSLFPAVVRAQSAAPYPYSSADACVTNISQKLLRISPAAQNIALSLTTINTCSWRADSTRNWVNPVRTGPLTLTLQITANPGAFPRLASVYIGHMAIRVEQSGSGAGTFSDVSVSHPQYNSIASLRALGLPLESPVGSGQFSPQAVATRGEAVQWLVQAMFGSNFSLASSLPYFSDVPPTHPRFRFVQRAAELGILTPCEGSASHFFCPDQAITLTALATLVVRAGVGNIFPYSTAPGYTDVSANVAAYPYLQKLHELNYSTGCGSNQICPGSNPSRAQLAEIVAGARALIGIRYTNSLSGVGPGEKFRLPVEPLGTIAPDWGLRLLLGSGQLRGNGIYDAPTTVPSLQTLVFSVLDKVEPASERTWTTILRPTPTMGGLPWIENAIVSMGSQSAASLDLRSPGGGLSDFVLRQSVPLGSVDAGFVLRPVAGFSTQQVMVVRASRPAFPQGDASALVIVSVPTPPLAPVGGSSPSPSSALSVSLTPQSGTLSAGQSLQFSAQVSGTTNQAVQWSLLPVVGSINASGLYTAPTSITSATTVTVRATSSASSTAFREATIQLQPPPAAPTISVSVSPPQTNMLPGSQVQFSATVQGTSNTGVVWSISPSVGSVSSTGRYSSPATLAAPVTVSVRATSVADSSKSAVAQVNVQASPFSNVSVTVSPLSVNVQPGATLSFSASVQGTSNTNVLWSLEPAVGSISPTGVYTAPATVTSPTTIRVRAASAADPTRFADANISLQASAPVTPITVTISANQQSVSAGSSVQFTATVSGTPVTLVGWSISPSMGSINANGLYVAPSVVSSTTKVSVRATSVADLSKFAVMELTVMPLSSPQSTTSSIPPPVTVSLSPSTGVLNAGATLQLTASVSNTSNTGVQWSLSPALGSITSGGLYTAPSSLVSVTTVRVRATSVADATKFAESVLSVNPPPAPPPPVSVSVTPASVSLSAGGSMQFTASVANTSNAGVNWSLSPVLGSITSNGFYVAPSSLSTATTISVRATSLEDSSKSAVSTLTLTPLSPLSVSPATISVVPGGMVRFTARVNGVITPVTWSISPQIGWVTSEGAYISPSTVTTPLTITIRAVSTSNPLQTGTAIITVPSTVTNNPVSVTKFTLRERYGVSQRKQLVRLGTAPSIDASTFVVDESGNDIPFQVMSDGQLAVISDLPANTTKTFEVMRGRAPKPYASAVKLENSAAFYEVRNTRTGVRVIRRDATTDWTLAPIQGVLTHDGRWTANGPNRLRNGGANLQAISLQTEILEQGPLFVSLRVTYGYNRAALNYGANTLIPAGVGFYTSTISLEAEQPSLVITEDTDMDLEYSLNFYDVVPVNQGRYRGHSADKVEFGREPDGQRYRANHERPPLDAVRDFNYDVPLQPDYRTIDSENPRSVARLQGWNLWAANTGWYWMLYDRNSATNAPVFGYYAGRASLALGAHNSGPGVYLLPAANNTAPAAGVSFQSRRGGPSGVLANRVRMQWALYVSSRAQALRDPYLIQEIGLEQNRVGGYSLDKINALARRYGSGPLQSSLYLSAADRQRIVDRVRVDKEYYDALRAADPSQTPLLDAWRDTSGAKARELVASLKQFARDLLQEMSNGNGIYGPMQYWIGGVEMSRRALSLSELMILDTVSTEDKKALYEISVLFVDLLTDNDFVPLFDGHGFNMGGANMAAQYRQYRNTFTMMLAREPVLQSYQSDLANELRLDLLGQVNEHGAHKASPHYLGAPITPLLSSMLQLRVHGNLDLFSSEEQRLSRFGEFLMQLSSPAEARFGGRRKQVSIGDGSTEGSELAGLLATGMASANPSLSARLMDMWNRQGKLQGSYAGSLIAKMNESLPAQSANLRSANFPGYLSVLRSGYGSAQENALWLINGSFYSDHTHDDQGSVSLYALSSPLMLDWGSLYEPQVRGPYMHSLVLPQASIGTAWNNDNLPLNTGLSPWTGAQTNAFESFAHSSRVSTTYTAQDLSTWNRHVRMVFANPLAPAVYIEDSFGGLGASAAKVASFNLAAQGTVALPAGGTMQPASRFWDRFGSRRELPSASSTIALRSGANRFAFSGQFGIDWDLYSLPDQDQEAIIGSWSHNWHPQGETDQFLAATGRNFVESQYILRIRGTGSFRTLLLPYAKGTPRAVPSVTQAGGVVSVTVGDQQYQFAPTYHAYQNTSLRTLASTGTQSVSAFGLSVSGGPTEITWTNGRLRIVAHGPAGTRTVSVSGGPQYSVSYNGGQAMDVTY